MPGAVDVATEVLDTIWELPDGLWSRIEPILKKRYPPAVTGRPRADLRRVLDGVIFRMRSGCQWNRMPERYGDDATVHRWFQRFVRDGVLEELWAVMARECDELGGVNWRWQAADGCMGKSRFSGEKRARTPLTEQNPAPRRA
jgi:putative transposase